MPLLKDNAFVENHWVTVGLDDALPSGGHVIVGVDRLTRDWDALAKFPGVLGVSLPNTTHIQDLAPYLPQIALVVVAFPAFNDGRSFSLVRQLRLDGYRGEIRATGNVLPDLLQFMLQVGIDSFEVGDRFSLTDWQKAAKQMSLVYQRGLLNRGGERDVWSERHRGFSAWEEQPHAG
jgi:uncharacterized protein (DUF934 family)